MNINTFMKFDPKMKIIFVIDLICFIYINSYKFSFKAQTQALQRSLILNLITYRSAVHLQQIFQI